MAFPCYWHCICCVIITVKPVYTNIKSAVLALGCLCIFSSCKYLPWHKPAEPSVEPAPETLTVPPAPVETPPDKITPPVNVTPLVPSITADLNIPQAAPVAPDKLAPVLPHHPIRPEPPIVEVIPSENPDPANPPVPVGSVTRNPADLLFYQAGNANPFNGSTTLLHEGGARKFDGSFKDGRREGEGMEWYPTGKLRYEGEFRNDRLHAGSAFWYYADSGERKMRADYVKGRLVRGLRWDRNGDLF